MTLETENNDIHNVEVDVEKIIDEIRRQILAKNAREGGNLSRLNVDGNHFSADFYENLYQASISYQHLNLQAVKSNVPLIGPLLDRLRKSVHQLILFYVNQFISEQARVNQLNVQLISELSIAIEKLAQQDQEQEPAG